MWIWKIFPCYFLRAWISWCDTISYLDQIRKQFCHTWLDSLNVLWINEYTAMYDNCVFFLWCQKISIFSFSLWVGYFLRLQISQPYSSIYWVALCTLYRTVNFQFINVSQCINYYVCSLYTVWITRSCVNPRHACFRSYCYEIELRIKCLTLCNLVQSNKHWAPPCARQLVDMDYTELKDI